MHSINGGTLKSSILISCLNHAPSIFGVSKHPYLVAPIMNSVRDGDPWWYHHYILSSDGLKTTSQSAESNVARGKSIRKSHLKSIIDSGFSMIFPFLGGFPHEKPPFIEHFRSGHCFIAGYPLLPVSPGARRLLDGSAQQRMERQCLGHPAVSWWEGQCQLQSEEWSPGVVSIIFLRCP